MPQYDLSQQQFIPGQPIAMNKSDFTPKLQENIVRHYFDNSAPGGYDTLSSVIQQQQNQTQQADPNNVTIPREDYIRLIERQNVPQPMPPVDRAQIEQKVNDVFSTQPVAPPPVNEQNLGTPDEPQLPKNESPDIMERLFGPQTATVANQPQQNDQAPTVNTQPNDDAALAERVKQNLAQICTARNIMPDEFIRFASSLTMDDIADLYTAFRDLNAQQQGGQAPLAQQQQQQQQPTPEYEQDQAPINLAEVQPNPVNYQTNDRYKNQISQFWK